MALGVYKPGQGYWVRVLTAVGAGSLVLATAMWAWSQAQAVNIPMPTWDLVVEDVRGELAGEALLELQISDPNDPTQRVSVGTATVESYSSGGSTGGTVVIGQIAMDGAATPADIEFLGTSSLGGAGDPLSLTPSGVSARVEAALGNPQFERLYLQAGVAMVIMILGAAVVYYFVAIHRGAAEFLIATDGEMKKVNWSTRREVVGSTWVVIFAAFLISVLLYGVDNVFFALFSLVGLHG